MGTGAGPLPLQSGNVSQRRELPCRVGDDSRMTLGLGRSGRDRNRLFVNLSD